MSALSTKNRLPAWSKALRNPARYKILSGGRGSGKSWAIADQLILDGAQSPHRILCAREYQASIKDSVHRLLSDRIEAWGLSNFYSIQRDEIIGANGTSFIFRGVRQNVQSIKSMTGLTRVWVEEAQTVTEESWRTLIPTVREQDSEIWLSCNPYRKEDATSQRFLERPPEGAISLTVNWSDNPFFPSTLNQERLRDQQILDPGTYAHIWEGAYLEQSNAQVFAGRYRIGEIETQGNPYYGVDFGFSQDPTAGVRCWIVGDVLYVDHAVAQIGLELDKTADWLIEGLPGVEQHISRADSARPESISYLRRHGLPRIIGASKGAGSVSDGIAHLKSYREIVVHPRCKPLLDELRLYAYQVDRLSGDVLPKLVDAHNHCIDALRYGLEPVMRRRELRIRGL